ncbi:MAG TPA: ribosome assembly cofactor RimP [Proteiniphilum sp.]|nr:ribosome assembly cofactor RimP [Proteiniphilum sp.]HPJ51064.1 ribosome assembly cofactor RimP [Proteiniphilum sp.]HPR20936.1 ribosome assembly cofactor RimP [Proteiniphilum sp.]
MIDKNMLISLTEEYLKDTTYYLVDLILGNDNSIIVEIDNDEGVDIDQCVALSRHIEAQLDRDSEDFELTVTSAGLTSPFKTIRQYRKYEGKEVEVLTRTGVKHNGILRSSDNEGFILTITRKVKPEGAKRKQEVDEDIRFKYDDVKYTKYLIRFK